MKPDLSQQVQHKQLTQTAKRGGRSDKNFDVGTQVLAKNFSTGRCWLEGTILRSSGPNSYCIELTDGSVICRHVNHIRNSTSSPLVNENDTDSWTDLGPNTEGPDIPDVQPQPEPPTPPEQPDVEPQISHSVRRSNRSTQGIPPDYLRCTV